MVTTVQECHLSCRGCRPHMISITATPEEPGWNSQGTQRSLVRTSPPTPQMAQAQQCISTLSYLISSSWQPAAGPQEFITGCAPFTQHLTSIPFLTHRLLMAPSCVGKWPVIFQCSCISRSLILARVFVSVFILIELLKVTSGCRPREKIYCQHIAGKKLRNGFIFFFFTLFPLV